MKNRNWNTQIILLLATFSIWYFSTHQEWVEKYYSNGIYPFVAGLLNKISSLFPFALGEVMVLIVICTIIVLIVGVAIKKVKIRSMLFMNKNRTKFVIRNLVTLVLGFILLFQLVWGLNYSRVSIGERLGFDVRPRDTSEVVTALSWHIEHVNQLRKELKTTDYNRAKNNTGYDVWAGYEKLPEPLNQLSVVKGFGKGLASSSLFSYAGIAGIYNPFLAEPNVNVLQVDFMLPVVEAHELAHLQGIAREDEANYTAVLVCLNHNEKLVQYSGHMLALIHLSNALYSSNAEAWEPLKAEISAGVKYDLERNRVFWESYEGWVEEASSDLNDTYLKLNGQKDGIKSYGRMVDLLLASFEFYAND